jgi:hypothetical protein
MFNLDVKDQNSSRLFCENFLNPKKYCKESGPQVQTYRRKFYKSELLLKFFKVRSSD